MAKSKGKKDHYSPPGNRRGTAPNRDRGGRSRSRSRERSPYRARSRDDSPVFRPSGGLQDIGRGRFVESQNRRGDRTYTPTSAEYRDVQGDKRRIPGSVNSEIDTRITRSGDSQPSKSTSPVPPPKFNPELSNQPEVPAHDPSSSEASSQTNANLGDFKPTDGSRQPLSNIDAFAIQEAEPRWASSVIKCAHLSSRISLEDLSGIFSHFSGYSRTSMNAAVDKNGKVRSCGLVAFQDAASAKIAVSQLTGVSLHGAVLQLEPFGSIPSSVSTSITKQPSMAMSEKAQNSDMGDAKRVVDEDVPRPLKRQRVETNVGQENQSLTVTTCPVNSTVTKERLERDENVRFFFQENERMLCEGMTSWAGERWRVDHSVEYDSALATRNVLRNIRARYPTESALWHCRLLFDVFCYIVDEKFRRNSKWGAEFNTVPKLAKICADDETEARRNGFLRNFNALYETFEDIDHCKLVMDSVVVTRKCPNARILEAFRRLRNRDTHNSPGVGYYMIPFQDIIKYSQQQVNIFRSIFDDWRMDTEHRFRFEFDKQIGKE
ncbi:hypothetical protein BKA61DRAFT_672075 [Leptodontidium sp. MPI-SDFR-AT-0119]|nr:hypothetical protein BKA61DRAFT_672075 [Leptodontidium sp. MPI-SDFR-AT-0119]